jgi:hypothetical protein
LIVNVDTDTIIFFDPHRFGITAAAFATGVSIEPAGANGWTGGPLNTVGDKLVIKPDGLCFWDAPNGATVAGASRDLTCTNLHGATAADLYFLVVSRAA